MLAVTDRVIEVIRQAMLAGNLPDGSGLRITLERESGNTATYGAMLTRRPHPADKTLIFSRHVRLFLAPPVSTRLSDKLLDVRVEPTEVVFAVTDRREPDAALSR